MEADDDVRGKERVMKIRSAVKSGMAPTISPWG